MAKTIGVEFESLDEDSYIVGGIVCVSYVEADGMENMYRFMRLDGTTLSEASQMGLVMHDHFHEKIMDTISGG